EMDSKYITDTSFEHVFVNTKVSPLGIIANFLTSGSYNVDRFYSKEFESKLIKILNKERFDVVQLESLFMTPYLNAIRQNSDASIILRSHNVEYKIWNRRTEHETNPIKKWYLHFLTRRLKRYELEYLNQYDGIAAISHNDLSNFKDMGCTIPIVEIPFGIDLNKYAVQHTEGKTPSLFCFAAMDWAPNEEGFKWFIDEVWGEVHSHFPDLVLNVAGKNMPGWMLDLKLKNVVVHGAVPDQVQFINAMDIMLVPLLSGSGIRVKIIEGLALGKSIISTSIGAEGIQCTDGEDILIADNAAAFVDKIRLLIEGSSKKSALEKSACELANSTYNLKKIITSLTNFYVEIGKDKL
ncbi:MAG: glycosyltransferase family 4 protein, partial [Bacteroidetes bacterium]|nr:glycosyltransferase family 4 protein [Bacteroidota bacterium]